MPPPARYAAVVLLVWLNDAFLLKERVFGVTAVCKLDWFDALLERFVVAAGIVLVNMLLLLE